MDWLEYYNKKERKKTLQSKESLFNLIKEVYDERLTKKEKSLLTDDFLENTLFEIFSGIDYSSISKLHESNTL